MQLDNVPEHAKAGLVAMNQGKPLANLESPQVILDRVLQGESVPEIAKDIGISHVSLYNYLMRHCPDEWMHASSARQLAKVADAQDKLDDHDGVLDERNKCLDGATVSRVRESARIAMWQLERTARKMYGQKDDSQNGVNIQVVIQPYSETGVVIDQSQSSGDLT